MARKLTDEKASLLMQASGLKPIEDFVNSNKPWQCECMRCGRQVAPSYSKVKQGRFQCGHCRRRDADIQKPLVDLVETELGFSVLIPPGDRFQEIGWFYEGRCLDVKCFTCDNTCLVIWRKHYETSRGNFKYWAICCPECRVITSQEKYGKAAPHLRKWSEDLLKKPQTQSLNSAPTNFQNLELTTRVRTCLLNANIRDTETLTAMTPGELMLLPNFGEKSMSDVVEALAKNGLSLASDPIVPSIIETWKNYPDDHGKVAVVLLDSTRFSEPIVLISVYAAHPSIKSANSIIKILKRLINTLSTHRFIVSGDWNLYYGYGLDDSHAEECRSFFQAMENLGFVFMGPQQPNGLGANIKSGYIPNDSRNVSTHCRSNNPNNRGNQLDFVFASMSLSDLIETSALNSPEDWGVSDHCRLLIKVKPETKKSKNKYPVNIISWNINKKLKAWAKVENMCLEGFADVFLLQEADYPNENTLCRDTAEIVVDNGWFGGVTEKGKPRNSTTSVVSNRLSEDAKVVKFNIQL